MTEPGTVLGTLDYLAPEQARDASSVDIRADIYGLGGTLFWCLTGETPFPSADNFRENVFRRLTQAPPSLRARAPKVSAELDAVVARMMACNPDERYPTPQAAMNALLRFLKPESQEQLLFPRSGSTPVSTAPAVPDHASGLRRVLVVDDTSLLPLPGRRGGKLSGICRANRRELHPNAGMLRAAPRHR